MKAATKQLLRIPSAARGFGSEEAAIPTALYDLHTSLKGKMVPFAGTLGWQQESSDKPL